MLTCCGRSVGDGASEVQHTVIPAQGNLDMPEKQVPEGTVKSLEEGTANAQRKVAAVDKLPSGVWIVAVAGAAERFAYYALSAPLRECLTYFFSKGICSSKDSLVQ